MNKKTSACAICALTLLPQLTSDLVGTGKTKLMKYLPLTAGYDLLLKAIDDTNLMIAVLVEALAERVVA